MKKIILTLLVSIMIFTSSFAAVKKNRMVHANNYEHHYLYKTEFNRDSNEAIAYYRVYRDAEHFNSTPFDYIKEVPVIIPFSAYSNSFLLSVSGEDPLILLKISLFLFTKIPSPLFLHYFCFFSTNF